MSDEIKALVIDQGEAMAAFITRQEKAMADERRARSALEAKVNRMTLTGDTEPLKGDASAEFKALGIFAKSGDDNELKSLAVSPNPEGGYLVNAQIASAIRTKIRDQSAIAALARRVTVTGADAFEEPYDRGEMGATWAGEKETRVETTNPTFGALRIPLDEIFVLQSLTQKLLDTSAYDVGAWVTERMAEKFSRAEGSAFVNGDGVGKPRGLMTYSVATTGDSTRTDGVIQYTPTGASGAFLTTAVGPDCLVDLVHSLRAAYTPNARWMMSRTTASTVRKLKDQQGQYLWQNAMALGQPDSLMGFPVVLDDEMPAIAANSLSIAFGDIQQAYTIADMPGLRMIRDPYSNKPYVQFYGYRRVGGGLCDSDAVKFLKFGTS
jgi:HK97 family phage major capsid protein